MLGITDGHFTINAQPTFLLGFSYFAALGAAQDSITKDLDDFQKHQFNWLRVWATWDAFGADVSAVDSNGEPRQPFMSNLKWLVAECQRRGLVVDITLARGRAPGHLSGFAAHQRAVRSLIDSLHAYPNWYLDLANERDVQDDRFVPASELKELRSRVRALDPQRLVCASRGGHDLDATAVREDLVEIGLDFVAVHRPREPKSPAETESKTVSTIKLMKEIGSVVPIQYQEPFRRGYAGWEPKAADFIVDLQGAIGGGAAGWCFHNGAQRGGRDGQPRRSFDLREHRLLDQLDPKELKFIRAADELMRKSTSK